jgi:hypothetical protein
MYSRTCFSRTRIRASRSGSSRCESHVGTIGLVAGPPAGACGSASSPRRLITIGRMGATDRCRKLAHLREPHRYRPRQLVCACVAKLQIEDAVRTHRGAILAGSGTECLGAQRIVFEQNITPSIFVETMAAMRELDHMNDRSILNRPTRSRRSSAKPPTLASRWLPSCRPDRCCKHSPRRSRRADFSNLVPGPASQPRGFWPRLRPDSRCNCSQHSRLALDCLNSCCGVE